MGENIFKSYLIRLISRLYKEHLQLWHHQRNGHEFEQALRDGEGQGSLACCSPWSPKESDTTEQLNNNSNILFTETSIDVLCLFLNLIVSFVFEL